MNDIRAKDIIIEMHDYWKKNSMTFQETQALEKAKEALKKQVPVNVEEGTEGGLDWYCKCGHYLSPTKEREIKYCPECGQKLNWDQSKI